MNPSTLDPTDTRVRLLDGPTGTELERRGLSLLSPLWSASAITAAEELLVSIHRDYVEASASILSANTFRTNPATLAQGGFSPQTARALTRKGVAIARRAAAGTATLVAGSVAPVGDCYRPGDQRSEEEIRADHASHIANLVEAGCDLLLVETMNSLPETLIAAGIALTYDRPVLVSMVVDRSGEHLLDGTDLAVAVDALDRLDSGLLRGILLNCASPAATRRGVETIAGMHRQKRGTWEFGGYPNSGDPDPVLGWDQVRTVPPGEFDREIERMLDLGARFIGGCCGTTPVTTARIRRLLDDRSAAA